MEDLMPTFLAIDRPIGRPRFLKSLDKVSQVYCRCASIATREK